MDASRSPSGVARSSHVKVRGAKPHLLVEARAVIRQEVALAESEEDRLQHGGFAASVRPD